MEDQARELFDEKVDYKKGGGGFRQVSDAFRGMLASRWVMFAQMNNIELEMGKATPAQVCRLAWIHALQDGRPICPSVSKRSELKNLLNRG